MYTLDLERLNLRSPYYIWQVKNGVYAFDTDYEVSYEIGLSVNTEMLQMEVCAFDINNKNHKPSPNDRKLRDTILAIIEEFFEQNNEVMLYVTATGDGRQAFRNRLFVRWFKTHRGQDTL